MRLRVTSSRLGDVPAAVGTGVEPAAVDELDADRRLLEEGDLLLAVGGDGHRLGNAVELEVAQILLPRRASR